MVYVVALDPASIQALSSVGALGEDQLIGIFEALLQNCMIAETVGTWRVGAELREAVKRIRNTDTRKRAVAILETLASPGRNRFVDVIAGHEDDCDTPLSDILITQARNAELDVIVCEASPVAGSVEFVSALRFNGSNFAKIRSRSACALIYAPGAKRAEDLLHESFARLVRHADIVEIYDRQMGKAFGDNYFHAVAHWCQFFIASGKSFELRIHTTDSQVRVVRETFADELRDSQITLRVIGHSEDIQPHDRFLRACGFTLDIGRGVDLFDKAGKCRDVKIGLSNHGEFTKQWRHLSSDLP